MAVLSPSVVYMSVFVRLEDDYRSTVPLSAPSCLSVGQSAVFIISGSSNFYAQSNIWTIYDSTSVRLAG